MVKLAVSSVYWTLQMLKSTVSNVYLLMVIHSNYELPKKTLDIANLQISGVQNLFLELETQPVTEPLSHT